ncbi:MAG: tRNA pseudouridine(38-40) synthase TruA [Rhizobacter sp.]|nr:tRNA pseudouridine(38-40) synthase TruA [Rhizobacter sp.]
MNRLALGIAYRGDSYRGWQSQPDGRTVQDCVESALAKFAGRSLKAHCAGRTDAGVHGLNQVIHLDTEIDRENISWVRGTNRHLPADIAVQWCRRVPPDFDARFSALGRRYVYVLLEAPVRPALESGTVGWTFRPLDAMAMAEASRCLLGEHDFSAFRSSQCQARTPVKTLRSLDIARVGAYWRFDFDASAFLHHMVRNLMGCLVAVGTGARAPAWLQGVLEARQRALAAPTFAAEGLYFAGPYYDAKHEIPRHTAAMDWLPR